jgi:hypothetical protein
VNLWAVNVDGAMVSGRTVHFAAEFDDFRGGCWQQVHIPFEKCLEPIPEELYRKACVYTTEEALASCQGIGYPAMIKASWGGGGKGIRKV